jgi:hypothetical protein
MGAERTLTDADVDAIAERVAEKLRRPVKVAEQPKKRETKAHLAAELEKRLRRAGIR